MAQLVTAHEGRSTDRRQPPSGLVVVLVVVAVVAALVFTLQPEVLNPSVDGCLIVIIGVPLLALARFLDRTVHRKQLSEIRDARRNGISIGTARLQRELVSLTDLDRTIDPGRHVDALNTEV